MPAQGQANLPDLASDSTKSVATQVTENKPASSPTPRRIFIGQLLQPGDDDFWAEVEGRITKVRASNKNVQLELSIGNSHLNVQVADKPERAPKDLMNQRVRIEGLCQGAYNPEGFWVPDWLRVTNWYQVQVMDSRPVPTAGATNTAAFPLLTTAESVERLSRSEAEQSRPVKIRGVITGVESRFGGIIVQDATRGLYVSVTNAFQPFKLRDFVEIEGVTEPGEFAPTVRATQFNRLGAGQMPSPIYPRWDQLLNGSMDAQFVEIKGVVTASVNHRASLLTPSGTLEVQLTRNGNVKGDLAAHLNDMISLRGVVLVQWDKTTHRLQVGTIRICDPTLTVERSAITEAFSALRQSPADLLLFDPDASLFQPVCVSGQVVCLNQNEGFLQASNTGLRFVAKNLAGIKTGDLVDVSGLPELGGASPILRVATVRKTGQDLLPAAMNLDSAQLSYSGWDATRVSVAATLVQMHTTAGEQILDLESGAITFLARLNTNAAALPPLIPGSRLQLTGVYAAKSGRLLSSANGAIFELLVNAPEDVTVRSRPPWWTPRRMAMALGVLFFVLLAALLWITQLRRRVEQRSRQLEEQIGRRKLLEQQRAMDNERQRIARDIHDDLGTGLTQIILASTHLDHDSSLSTASRPWARDIINRARSLTRTMDEVVWAINPRNDTLESLMSYLNKSAQDALSSADIRCRWDLPDELPDQPLTAEARHSLFLACKEAIHNIIKHAAASEVWIRLKLDGDNFSLAIEDNGKGFDPEILREHGHGLTNMRKRLEESGGRCEIKSQSAGGACVTFLMGKARH